MRPYSSSRLAHWNDCQYSWAAYYLRGLKGVDSAVMSGGRLFHRLGKKYLQHLIDTDQPTDIEVLDQIIKTSTDTEPLTVIEEYTRIFRDWAPRQNLQSRNENDVWLEKRLAIDNDLNPIIINNDDDWESEKIFVRGIIDKLQMLDIPTIIDYKTNHIIPTENEIKDSLQTRIYPMLVAANFDIKTEIRIIYEFVRYGVKMEFIIYPEQYIAIKDWLKKIVNEIENTKEYTATFCSRCEYCAVRDECPAMKRALENNNIITPVSESEAIALGETLIAIKEKGKTITDLLKIYIENHGSFIIGDQEYRQNVNNSYEFKNIENLVNMLIAKGIPKSGIWDMLNCSKTDFERVMKRLKMKDMIEDVIEETGTPVISTMTKFYKVK